MVDFKAGTRILHTDLATIYLGRPQEDPKGFTMIRRVADPIHRELADSQEVELDMIASAGVIPSEAGLSDEIRTTIDGRHQ